MFVANKCHFNETSLLIIFQILNAFCTSSPIYFLILRSKRVFFQKLNHLVHPVTTLDIFTSISSTFYIIFGISRVFAVLSMQFLRRLRPWYPESFGGKGAPWLSIPGRSLTGTCAVHSALRFLSITPSHPTWHLGTLFPSVFLNYFRAPAIDMSRGIIIFRIERQGFYIALKWCKIVENRQRGVEKSWLFDDAENMFLACMDASIATDMY